MLGTGCSLVNRAGADRISIARLDLGTNDTREPIRVIEHHSGASLGYQLASPFAGGLAPLIASALLEWSEGNPCSVAAYIGGMCVVTWISVYLAEETNLKEMTEPEAS